MLLRWIAVACVFSAIANGSGVAVHLTILQRSSQALPDKISQPAALSGAFYPDAFYTCLGSDLADAAEFAHWPPFLKIAVDYYQEKYGHIKDVFSEHSERFSLIDRFNFLTMRQNSAESDALRLKSFLYGVLSHQVADVSWHSLGVKQGLLEMLAQREFGGDVAAAHEMLDPGGDMILLRRLLKMPTQKPWLLLDWDPPVDDIVQILKRSGYSVSKTSVVYCVSRGRAAVRGELSVAPAASIHYASQSPLLYRHLNDYHLGGMSEMVVSTMKCMEGLDRWFEHGTPSDPWTLCHVFKGMIPHTDEQYVTVTEPYREQKQEQEEQLLSLPQIYERLPRLQQLSSGQYLFTHEPQSQFGTQTVLGDFLFTGKGSLAVSAPFDGSDMAGAVFIIDLQDIKTSGSSNNIQDLDVVSYRLNPPIVSRYQRPPKSAAIAKNYPRRFGAAVTKISLKGYDYLAVSSPGLSTVDIFSRHKVVAQVHVADAAVEYGKPGKKLVGENLFAYDLNDDGYDDLIIGAPYEDSLNKAQTGAVYVIDGKVIAVIIEASTIEFQMESIADRLASPQGTKYGLFGSSLAANRNYLFVGSEGRSSVYAYHNENLTHAFTISQEGDFGGGLLTATESVLAIGESTANLGSSDGWRTCTQCGKVHIYNLDEQAFSDPVLPPNDVPSFSRFGQGGQFINSRENERKLLVKSRHGFNEQGAFWLMDKNGAQVVNMLGSYGSGFASDVATNGSSLAVGIPYYGDAESHVGAVLFNDNWSE